MAMWSTGRTSNSRPPPLAAVAARSAYETGQPAELPLPPEFADVALAHAFRQLRGDPPNESPNELRRRLNVS
jgi:hypothetical protein